MTEHNAEIDAVRGAIEAEWFNGNMAEDCRDRLLAALSSTPTPAGPCCAGPPASVGLPGFVNCPKPAGHSGRHWYAIEWGESNG